ncbi:PmoA family protein [Glycomyces tritici]|uniref:PmoA family protein n=1 Tax=Glycomyces tritici TaxID=2665176 RepID=A0ABT7YY16_9ACTN|nr:PmoA family protein [Glycomyces tritici]MDN3243482.1 PmoA family protein [Glycomyces tritici]
MHDPLTLSQTVPLILGGRTVAEYVWRPHLPNTLSPRPFLHPVRTLTGTTVTEAMPPDHRHHLGAGLAVPDAGGANFWGGRTYVRDQGSTLLPNHGTQRHHRWETRTDTDLTHELHWIGPDQTTLLHEHRRITARPLDHHAWALDFRYTLRNLTAAPLDFSSPGAKGRTGAGYGGFFWRAPLGNGDTTILGPDRNGIAHLHGSTVPWLALRNSGPAPWTLILINPETEREPWFVRGDDYLGAGPALAWTKPLTAAPGNGPTRRIITVIADGDLSPQAIKALVEAAAASPAPREA